jgi:hypothetical protein
VLLAPGLDTVPSAAEAVYGLAEVVVGFVGVLGLVVLVLAILREIGR